MHIVLLHQYHHNPDCPAMCRHYDFAARWAQRHDVTIIGSDAWLSKRITNDYPWTPAGVRLKSLSVPYDNRMSARQRLLAFATFATKARSSAASIHDADVIIGTSTPLTVGWAAQRAAAKLDVPFVFEVRDLWPDFPIEAGAIRSRRLQRWLRRKERDLYGGADHVVTLSPDMTAHVLGRGGEPHRVSTILQGSDVRLARKARESEAGLRLRDRHGMDEGRVILYAGAFGRANAIPTLLEAARLLEPQDELTFVFVGHGYHTGTIESAARSTGNIRLIAPVPRHAIFDWFAAADLSIASFVGLPSVAASSPSKLFDSLATGCPVIVTNPGWTKSLVEEHQCGWYSPAEDAEALAATITRVLEDHEGLERARRSAVQLAHEQFDRHRLADDFESILVEVVDRDSRRLQ
jgi:glycosyltransferase involved in cell wall biosynthesis